MYKLNAILFAIITFLFFSCTKTVTHESAAQMQGLQATAAEGKVTPVGTPEGPVESKAIGINGGTFTSSDKRLTIKFPQGALSSKTTVTIQPISNNTPGGTGKAYRITPHGLNFSKPVSITFNYVHDDLSKTVPVALAIAYQDANGIWQAAGDSDNDTAMKKITINTTHFSDWSLFMSYEIVPKIAFVATGSTTLLKVVKRLNTNDLSMPLPAGPVYDTIEAGVKEWKLTGPGQLRSAKNTASYVAPLTVPAKQPIKVSAQLETPTGKYLFTSNIYIGGASGVGADSTFTGEGLAFRVDKGPWQYAICADGVKMIHTPLGDERYFTAFIPGSPNADAVTFHWMDQAKAGTTLKWTTTFPDFQYSYKENNNSIYYFQYALPGGTASAGGIKWLESNETPGGHISGTFDIATSGKIIVPNKGVPPPPGNHEIDGFFNIVWGGN